MNSAKERDEAEKTCIVAGWERGHCSEAYRCGQHSAHLLYQQRSSFLLETNQLFSLGGGMRNFKSGDKTSL